MLLKSYNAKCNIKFKDYDEIFAKLAILVTKLYKVINLIF